ncbi:MULTISPECIES: DUF1054 family protein [unclassified Paenibacillus]|uniref:DUF1054 family protein n=1 Tax=unclassified Paenibacillus TaxID=185978 RepID=UPI0030F6E3D5
MPFQGFTHDDFAVFQIEGRKLKEVKKAEITCGLRIDKDDPILSDEDKLLELIRQTFETLLPLYRMSF